MLARAIKYGGPRAMKRQWSEKVKSPSQHMMGWKKMGIESVVISECNDKHRYACASERNGTVETKPSNFVNLTHSSTSLDRRNIPAFIRTTQNSEQSMRNTIHSNSTHEDFTMSDIFSLTMRKILIRSNMSNSDIFHLVKQYGSSNTNYSYNCNGNSSDSAIQYRYFSTSPIPPGKSDGEGGKSKSSTSSSKTSSSSPTQITHSSTSAMKKIPDNAQALLSSAIKSLTSLILKMPGVLWFYMTNPKEFKEKMLELKDAAKKEAHHYYMGSKLLMADVRTAKAILGQTLQGTPLSRRERKQLLRTATDVFRLVPMSIFVLIPFMEFALPFALRIFPNMLPSTFQDTLKEEERMKRELKSRLAMAEFFQETLHDLARGQKKKAKKKKEHIADNDGPSSDLESSENREETAASFLEFIEKARQGEFLPPEVVVRYAKYFKDELTLDNMPRMQLINMCKYMSIPPYGNDNVLRFQLRHKIRGLIEDDQRILWEGIDSLTKMELREACQERGMRSTGLSKMAYTRALQQWIDLSVNRNVPISLLVMSRTFFLQEEMTGGATSSTNESKSVTGLADAISGLDKEVVNEVILKSVTTGKEKDPDLLKLKLEVLEQQNELIEEEKQQRDAEATKAEAAKVDKEKGASEEIINVVEMNESTSKTQLKAEESIISDTESTFATSVEKEKEIPESGTEDSETEEDEASLSSQEIDAISELVSPDPVSSEREQLENIKAALSGNEDEIEREEEEASQQIEARADGETTDARDSKMTHEDISIESITVDTADEVAEAQISALEKEAKEEAETATKISLDGKIDEGEQSDQPLSAINDEDEEEYSDKRLDKAVSRLKTKVESMVDNLEVQISDVEAKIGDKLHFLDKDMDGILSREEMAACLQTVLKRPLTFDEAMVIAAEMDENEDGLFSVDELSKWLETNKLVKLVEEGRDAEVDKIIESHAAKLKEREEKKDGDK